MIESKRVYRLLSKEREREGDRRARQCLVGFFLFTILIPLFRDIALKPSYLFQTCIYLPL